MNEMVTFQGFLWVLVFSEFLELSGRVSTLIRKGLSVFLSLCLCDWYVLLINCVDSEDTWLAVMGTEDEIPPLADLSDVEYILDIFYARDVKSIGGIKPAFSFCFLSNSGKLNRR